MKTIRWRSKLLCAPVICGGLGLLACDDGGKPREREELEAAASAALGGPDEATLAAQAAEQERLKEIYAKREAEEKEAAAKTAATIEALVVLPEKLPKTLDEACDGMIKAYDEYKRRTIHDDRGVLDWVDNSRAYLGVRRVKCVAVGSIEAAACQASALAAASDDFGGHDLDILTACVNKFAPDKLAELAAKAVEADHAALK